MNASDLMRTAVSVTPEDALLAAFENMRAAGLPQIPVVNERGEFLGFVDEATIALEYLRRASGRT